jgi:hypothetical protein
MAHRRRGDRRLWAAVTLWTMADRLAPAAFPGTASIAGELLRRLRAAMVKLGGATGKCRAERWRGESEMRGEGDGVEKMSEGRPPFIATEGGRGSAVRSAAATSLQGLWGTGADAGGLATSQR